MMQKNMRKNIPLTYHPRDWAIPFHKSDKRFMVLVVHRRAGKTTASINFMQLSALRNSGARYAYIAPTYKQAKNVAWDIIKDYSRCIPDVEHMETELSVKYPNGSKITLFGADNPDSLRGMGLWGVVFDEYSQQPGNIFTEIVRPMLSDHNGYAIWIGTPKGKNAFFRLYEQAKTNPEDYLSLLLTADQTGVISKEEIASNQKTMSADEFQQEWYCSFDSSLKGAYYANELAQARQENRIGDVPYHQAHRVYTVWDIGIGPKLAIGFYQRYDNKVYKIDYWEGSGDESIADGIRIVLNEKRYAYGKHFAPHDISQKEISSGQTRWDIAKKLGMAFEVVPKSGVDDGINKVKMMFNRLWIDEQNCSLFIDALSQYRREWSDDRGMFMPRPYHDWTSHAADELRYAAIVEDKMEMRPRFVRTYPEPTYDDLYAAI